MSSRGPVAWVLLLSLAGAAFGQQKEPPGQQDETIVRLPPVPVTTPARPRAPTKQLGPYRRPASEMRMMR